MDPVQKDKPNVADAVTITPRPEGTPIAVSNTAEQSGVAMAEPAHETEQGPKFAPAPELDDSVKGAGVVSHPDPEEHPDVKVDTESNIANGASFASSNLSVEEAGRIAKTADVKTSSPWRALLDFIKKIKARKLQSSQRV